MTDRNNITSASLEELAAAHSDDLAEHAVRWLAQMSRMRIRVLLHELFEQIDEALFTAAEQESGNNNENIFAQSLREVRRQRQAVVDCFCTRMMSDFESFELQGTVSGSAAERQNASDNNDINQAFAAMQSKAEDLCFRALNELNQHLGELHEQPPIQLADNPLAPGNLCRCFDYAIGLIAIDASIKLTICKNFDRYLISQMQFVLDFINDELRKLAKLKESSKPKQQHHLFATIKSLLASKRIANQQEKYQEPGNTRVPVDASTGIEATRRDTTDQMLGRWFVEATEDEETEEVPEELESGQPIEPPARESRAVFITPEEESRDPAETAETIAAPTLQLVGHTDELLDDDGQPLPDLVIEPPSQPPGSIESGMDVEWFSDSEADLEETDPDRRGNPDPGPA